ncbi:MAG: hypothetical protein KH703_08355 [Campylobacter gracilis]|uniref:hypothetical protein n=1 Tax=Campylobacter gracilis TaxID=824 RepID=UPI0026F18EB1|nr:hypothetical protein [Campylobacter gracilis]MBS6153384.1 hypothetical protein [Campylobacter gracilis]
MRSLFSGEICAAADKFKFAFERSFEILFSHVLILSVEFPANSAAKILNDKISLFRTSTQSASRGLVKTLRSKISLSRILSNEALLRGILLGRNPLLGASSRKISYPWIYERKIPARKISFFEILKALFYRANTAPRSLGALNFTLQNPLAVSANVASENSCAMRAVKFIKFTGSANGFETAPSLALTAAADRTQVLSFTAVNFAATKVVKARSVAIKAIIAKVANALSLATSCVFARLKNRGDLKEASRAH